MLTAENWERKEAGKGDNPLNNPAQESGAECSPPIEMQLECGTHYQWYYSNKEQNEDSTSERKQDGLQPEHLYSVTEVSEL